MISEDIGGATDPPGPFTCKVRGIGFPLWSVMWTLSVACRYDERSIRKCYLETREGHEIDGLSSAKAQSTFGQSIPHGRTIPFVLLASCGIKARGSDEEVRHD